MRWAWRWGLLVGVVGVVAGIIVAASPVTSHVGTGGSCGIAASAARHAVPAADPEITDGGDAFTFASDCRRAGKARLYFAFVIAAGGLLLGAAVEALRR